MPPIPPIDSAHTFTSIIRAIDPTEYGTLFQQPGDSPPQLRQQPQQPSARRANFLRIRRRPDHPPPQLEFDDSLESSSSLSALSSEAETEDRSPTPAAPDWDRSGEHLQRTQPPPSDTHVNLQGPPPGPVYLDLENNMPPRRRSANTTTTNASTTSRPSRRRTATQAFEGESSEADHEGNISPTAGPSSKRRNVGDEDSAGEAASSRAHAEPIVIDDLDDEEEQRADPAAQILKEALQKQREEQVRSQQAAADTPKLSKLQCVICMDSFTDMTATSCGRFLHISCRFMSILTQEFTGHIFCHECLISALRASETRRFQATGVHGKRSQCPVCRTNLNRSKAGDLIPLLIMKKGLATQPRRARAG